MKFLKSTKKLTPVIDNKLLLIVFSALLLRLVGTMWGFPYIYHPDEPTLVKTALGLELRDLNPDHFDWPHMQAYLSAVVFEIFIKGRAVINMVGLKDLGLSIWPFGWDDPTVFYFLERIISAVMGSLTVGLVYLLGKRFHSVRVGVLAALFLFVNSVHVSNSRLATLDVPMTFWNTLSLFFALSVARTGKTKDYLLAGLMAGFATSTKYNGGLSTITIAVAFIVYVSRYARENGVWKIKVLMDQGKNLSIAAITSIIGFFIGTPYALLDWKSFSTTDSPEGAFWQFAREVNSGDLTYLGRLRTRLFQVVPEAQGLILTLLSYLAIPILTLKHRAEYLLLVVYPLIYLWYVAGLDFFQDHFFMPVYPYLSLLAALVLVEVITWLGIKSRWNERYVSGVVALAVIIILYSPVRMAISESIIISQPDTRTLAVIWLEENVEDGAVIALGSDYEPKLRDKEGPEDTDRGYYQLSFGEFERVEKLNENLLEKLHLNNVGYVILGGYGLGDRYDGAQWNKNDPTRLGWLKENLKLIKRIDPVQNPGPTVLIFEVEK